MRGAAFVLIIGLAISSVRAEAPLRFNYQAKVTDATGAPINGTPSCSFAIYAAPTGGLPLYTELASVAVSDGVLNHVVGSITPLSLSLFEAAGDLYLETTIDGSPIVPRVALDSAPFALRAQSSKSAGTLATNNMLLTFSQTPPAGYTYTGMSIQPGGTGSWTGKAPMPTARSEFAVAVANGKIYAIGGYTGTAYTGVNEEYDPATNTWATKAPMSPARNALAAATVNGKIYAIGGYTGTDFTNLNQEYNPATNTWANKSSMPTARRWLCAVTANNKIYAIGGDIPNAGDTDATEQYDPATNAWLFKAAIQTPRRKFGAAEINGKIYISGGSNLGYLNTTEEYTPAINDWSPMASMPDARESIAAAANDRMYMFGGSLGSGTLATVHGFDAASNTWSTATAMPTSRHLHAAATIGSKIYVIGGLTTAVTSINEEFLAPDPAAGVLYVHRSN
jgi:N-acetylneuraminic acid mutarotase